MSSSFPSRSPGRGDAVSIIVPTYREAENLRPLVDRIRQVMPALGRSWEVIIVDDDSRDGSDQVIAELAAEGLPVRLITRVGVRGLSSAVIDGFGRAIGDTLVCMDADLSHPPEAIPALLDCLAGGADFAIGSRYVPGASTDEGWGLFRWVNSKVATLLAWPFTKARDPMAGFFALPRAVFHRAAALNPIGYKIALELIVKCGCKDIREVPIHFANRKFGQSKLSLKEQVNYLKHIKRLADYKYGWFSRLFQFCLVGGTGAVVDLSAYALLLDLGAHPLARAMSATEATHKLMIYAARALAILVAMTWNFFFNRRVTYSHMRGGRVWAQYWRFVSACSVGAGINWFISCFLPSKAAFFKAHLLAAAIVGILAGLLFNFTLSHLWVFRRRQRGVGGEGA
ncbi:MAG: glycosyltransferase family 2 protein [Phycisphaerae bacterium]|nr:glycosyltransferase family 2 protein [Phycisphaerae bacterium]